MKNRQNGFTLIEVLTVLIIMGIVSSIAVPTINNMIINNEVEKEKSTLKNLNDRSRLYTAITGKSIDDLFKEGKTTDDIIVKLVNEGYLEESPSISNDKAFSYSSGEWVIDEKSTDSTDNGDTSTSDNNKNTSTYPLYEHGVRYYKGDKVTYNDKNYRAKRSSKSKYPTKNRYWTEID